MRFAFVAVLVLAQSLAAQDSAPSPQIVPEIVKYGGDRAYAPFEYLEDGVPRGFQVDLILAIGRAMDVKVDVKLDDWSRIREALTAGTIDLACMSEVDMRRPLYEFSDPHSVKASEIFIRKNSPPIRSLQDTEGKVVIVQKGAVAHDELTSQGIQATIIGVESELEAIRLLASGKHDCAITTSFGGRQAIDVLKCGDVVASSPIILRARIAFATRKGNTALIDWVNEGLDRVRLSGEYNRIYHEWFPPVSAIPEALRRVMGWMLWILLPFFGVIVALAVISRVLKSKVEERTRELNLTLTRLELALKTSHLIVYQQDLDLRYTWILNFHPTIPSAALLGKTDEEILPPSIRDFVITKKRSVLTSGVGTTFEVEVPEGLGMAFRTIVEPWLDSSGKVLGLNCASMDITASKTAEANRLDLERRILQSEKLETLGKFAGGIAHDFNNLLAGILGNAALAAQDVKHDSAAAEKLAIIERTAKTASDLTQQLLSFAGHGQVQMGPVDVGAAAQEIAEVLRGAIPNHVLVVCEDPPALPPVHGNGAQVRQVIMNLVKNGADAVGSRPGHVTIRCSLVHATRALLDTAAVGSETREGEYVCVEVTDDGDGMDEETLARSLERFFTTKEAGRGIGLAVVVGAIQRHRGAIFVKSIPRVGTTFRALFPVVKVEAPTGEARRRPEEARHGSHPQRRVLVVDDHKTVRDVICETLVRAGCAVEPAATGAEALQQFTAAEKAEPFACVVLDLTLPDIYGLDTFVAIRKLNCGAHVILTSGHDEHGALSRVANDPNVVFLPKPFTPSELVKALDRLTGVAKAG